MLRESENCVLRGIFGPKTDEGTGGSRRRQSEEFYGLYCSPDFIRLIKLLRMSWVGHVAQMEGRQVSEQFWSVKRI